MSLDVANITAQVHPIALSRRSAVLCSLHTYPIRLHCCKCKWCSFLLVIFFLDLTAGLSKSNNPSLSLLPFFCVSCNILLLASSHLLEEHRSLLVVVINNMGALTL